MAKSPEQVDAWNQYQKTLAEEAEAERAALAKWYEDNERTRDWD